MVLLALLAVFQLDSLAAETTPPVAESPPDLSADPGDDAATDDPGEPPASAPAEATQPGEAPQGEEHEDVEPSAPSAEPPVASQDGAVPQPAGEDGAAPRPAGEDDAAPEPHGVASVVRASTVVIVNRPPVVVDPDDVVVERKASGTARPATGKARRASVRPAQAPPRTEAEIFPPGGPCEIQESKACEDHVSSLLVCRDPGSAACGEMLERLRSDPCSRDTGSEACEGWVIEHLLLGLSVVACEEPEAVCLAVLRGVPILGCPEAQPRTSECVAVQAVLARVCDRFPICGVGGTSEPTDPRGRPSTTLVGLFDPGGRGDRGRTVSAERSERARPRRLARTGLELEPVAALALVMLAAGLVLRRRIAAAP